MGMRIEDGKVVEVESSRWQDAFKDSVNSIDLELVLSQLDLESWMPEWLGDEKKYGEDDIDCLDWREIALRGIYNCAVDAKRILVAEYGLGESDFAEDDVA